MDLKIPSGCPICINPLYFGFKSQIECNHCNYRINKNKFLFRVGNGSNKISYCSIMINDFAIDLYPIENKTYFFKHTFISNTDWKDRYKELCKLDYCLDIDLESSEDIRDKFKMIECFL